MMILQVKFWMNLKIMIRINAYYYNKNKKYEKLYRFIIYYIF